MFQDYIMAIIAVMFSYSLIPTIKNVLINRVQIRVFDIKTLIISALGLYIVAFVMLSLNLIFSFIMNLITASCWLILFIVKINYKE